MNLKQLLAIGLVFAIGCGTNPQVFTGAKGEKGDRGEQGLSGLNGLDGTNGTNGHSIVSDSRAPTSLECANGGTAVDMYLDLDDSLSYSSGDTFLNSVFACNGAQGAVGPQGPVGSKGDRGEKGDKGDQGDDGSAGAKGDKGDTGAQGPAGANATGTVQRTPSSGYLTTTCVLVNGTSVYAKRSSSSADLYASSSCTGTKIATLNDNSNETYWFSNNILIASEGGSSNMVLRAIIFTP